MRWLSDYLVTLLLWRDHRVARNVAALRQERRKQHSFWGA